MLIPAEPKAEAPSSGQHRAAQPLGGANGLPQGQKDPFSPRGFTRTTGSAAGEPGRGAHSPRPPFGAGVGPWPLPAVAQPRRAGPGGHFSEALPPRPARVKL